MKDENNEGICKCGHHSKDHSYDPVLADGKLYCYICECKNYVFDHFEEDGN